MSTKRGVACPACAGEPDRDGPAPRAHLDAAERRDPQVQFVSDHAEHPRRRPRRGRSRRKPGRPGPAPPAPAASGRGRKYVVRHRLRRPFQRQLDPRNAVLVDELVPQCRRLAELDRALPDTGRRSNGPRGRCAGAAHRLDVGADRIELPTRWDRACACPRGDRMLDEALEDGIGVAFGVGLTSPS